MKQTIFEPKLFSSLGKYNRTSFSKDIMSGIIVGIVALPLAISFGIASGVSPEEGLITAIIGGLIVSFFGGSSVQIGGPAGAFVVIVYGIISKFGIEGLAIATLMAGVMLILMGIARLGVFISFIPYPIIVGFTSGIAMIIFASQIGELLGMHLNNLPADFISQWQVYFENISKIDPASASIGIASILIIIFASKRFKIIPGSLIAIVLMTVICYFLRSKFGITSIETIGDKYTISASIPKIKSFSFTLDTLRELFPSAFTIAILGAIESLLSATVAEGVVGDKHNPNTELIAQGVANITVPFFGGIPVTGAIARTMTNINNGGRSPIAGITHAIVLLLIFLFLAKLTMHIPLACLAGVLVMVAYNMSQWRTFKSILTHPRSDIVVLLVTFSLTVILDLTIAIEVGMLLALLLFMRRVSQVSRISLVKNKIDLSKESELPQETAVLSIPKGVEIYEIQGPFFFGIAQKFDETTNFRNDNTRVRIFRMRQVPFMDSTGLHNLSSLINQSKKRGITIFLSGVNQEVRKTLENGGLADEIGKEKICNNIHEALEKTNEYLDSLNQEKI